MMSTHLEARRDLMKGKNLINAYKDPRITPGTLWPPPCSQSVQTLTAEIPLGAGECF